MTRITRAWSAMSREQRLAALAAVAMLVTMFFPWYGLQSLNRRTGVIYSHEIDAFGDVSFVEAAIFLVAAGVIALLLARAEDRDFNMPGGDGTILALAGGWATLLIFYRVFDRPAGHGYPVGIEWGFFLAFVASSTLAYAGWRIRHGERPEPPALRRSRPGPEARREQAAQAAAGGAAGAAPPRHRSAATPRPAPAAAAGRPAAGPARRREEETGETELIALGRAPAPARERSERPRYPPAPGEPQQLSFDEAAGGSRD